MKSPDLSTNEEKRIGKFALWGIALGVLLFVIFLSVSSADAVVYNIDAGNCMIVSNDSYCAKWPIRTVTLEYNKSFNEMNFTVTAPPFPKINEVLSLGISEQKSYPDYNLTAKCLDVNYTNITVDVNSTYTDNIRKVNVYSGLGKQAVQDVVEGTMD